ncbi:MAG: hypothetical protein EOM23_09810 [Candidatus Moranbacteria bacterium]|nr:hypothetical protein [Candidatus Moranbacteria bacterium]
MEKGTFLAKSSAGNITRCIGGCLHVNIPGVSLHMTEEQFIAVSRLMQDASESIMNSALKILFDDSK